MTDSDLICNRSSKDMNEIGEEKTQTILTMESPSFAWGILTGVAIGLGIASMMNKNDLISAVPSAKSIKPKSNKKATMCSNCNKQLEQNLKINDTPKESLLHVLQRVLKKINPKRDAEKLKERNEQVKTFVENILIEKLKGLDELFKMLYRRIVWSGSFYDGLKIDEADEFDLNIVFKFPFPQDKLEVTTVNLGGEKADPAFAFVNYFAQAIKELETNKNLDYIVYKKMEKWCDDNGSLLQNKVRCWFQSLMTKLLLHNRETIETQFGKVMLKESGPAMTMVFLDDNLSIDFVPTFEFLTSGGRAMMPPPPFRQPSKFWPWYIVPKPVRKMPNRPADYGTNMWRLSFSSHEKELIQGKETLKPAIKLMKKLRDSLKWPNLASYYIKTLFLWEVCENSLSDKEFDDTSDWSRDLAQVFMQMLQRLLECLEKGEIRSFWDENYNLLEGMGESAIKNMMFKLKSVMKKFKAEINTNPSYIGQVICPECPDKAVEDTVLKSTTGTG